MMQNIPIETFVTTEKHLKINHLTQKLLYYLTALVTDVNCVPPVCFLFWGGAFLLICDELVGYEEPYWGKGIGCPCPAQHVKHLSNGRKQKWKK